PIYKSGRIDRELLRRNMPLPLRIIVRNLMRRKWKASISVFMISLAVAILIAGRYTYDAVDRMVQVEFSSRHREDVTVVFNEPMPPSVAQDLASIDGVLEHEYYREEPVKLRFGHRTKRQALKGLESASGLQRLVDRSNRSFALPEEGVLLTGTLADALGVRKGDTLMVELLQGSRRSSPVRVSGTIDEILGLSAYMNIRQLDQLAGDGGALNAAYLRLDPEKATRIYQDFKNMPGIAGIMMLRSMKESFNRLIAQSMTTSTLILTSFACVLAFAVVYNGARISLSERARELSSLRVLGFSMTEISVILLGEQAILILFAIPLGFLLGILLSAMLSLALSSELYRLPVVFSTTNFLFAFCVITGVALVSALLIHRRLVKLDLIAVLKTRE
ncbi:MAG: FtsX-like permease family protein, partial [Chlorobiaceae bacterium]|nr:FtsX-like permease family protein [Chlorobiaceae bacterium]